MLFNNLSMFRYHTKPVNINKLKNLNINIAARSTNKFIETFYFVWCDRKPKFLNRYITEYKQPNKYIF